ncbi:putative glutamine transport system permease protein [Streptococcus pneumoniae]|nr:putative glutamine transport system permease protein [Streptococcus pneumoniae]VNO74570.1 putative glutamine transport system permease protein [Streptococcus pneumoniae]
MGRKPKKRPEERTELERLQAENEYLRAENAILKKLSPNHSYLSQLDVTYKTPDLMSHFLPPHEVSFTFCCSSIVFPR